MKHSELVSTHEAYQANQTDWEFHLRSFLGGSQYRAGEYLLKYIQEDVKEYNKRIDLTPLDNHCKNVVSIYSSFVWRVPPTRNLGAITNDQAAIAMLSDADLDGRSFNAFMRDAQTWSDVYGHCWVMVDKPESNAKTRAEELDQEIRPYLNLITPENVLDWQYERSASGRYVLVYFKVREMQNADITVIREWTPLEVVTYQSDGDKVTVLSKVNNPVGMIPAVALYGKRSPIKGIGVSSIADVASMQKAIYNELSEIEQIIRISNHPTLVKSTGTDASAGAGGVINIADEEEINPYLLQPSAASLSSIMESIKEKTQAINRMSHMGAVRGSEALTMSGVALQSEFQLLNAKLAEKADLLELAEEQIWDLFCLWQDLTNDTEINYPESFDLRDYATELAFLQSARASGVASKTFMQGVDKAISELVLADEDLVMAIKEIEDDTKQLGQFEKGQIYKYHIDGGVVSPNEARVDLGLDPMAGGDVIEKAPIAGQPE